jgi:N-acetyl sugar amidotransferase
MSHSYRMCTRCIMDTTDPDIQFDENGVCNHCRGYEEKARSYLRTGPKGQAELNRLVEEIKAKGKGKEYDCVLGVSGGVDSTYVAYTLKNLGLRPLAVHMDNGWDAELAVSNIEKFLNQLDIDLYTYVLDWEEFKDLQLAFLKASVSDAEIPTDHAIAAVLYQVASERNIKYIISGSNLVTEGILPNSWTYGVNDWRYIKSVHHIFGSRKLKRYPHYSFLDLLYYIFVKRIQLIRILNYIPYNKEQAIDVLENQLSWRNYGGKHYESIYTRFFQGYILPKKFNIDKRQAHLSTLICSGQITREEALAEMQNPAYAGYMLEEDMEYVLKKLELAEDEFEHLMSLPTKSYKDYRTYLSLRNVIRKVGIGNFARRLGLLHDRSL